MTTPKLIVFDLDFTVWYPEMYEMQGAPFTRCKETGIVTDCENEQVQMFDDMHEILRLLHTDEQFASTKVAVASRTTYPKWAKRCMELLHVEELNIPLDSIIDYETIYPRNKKTHFRELKDASGIDFHDMLFFDNERYNITDVKALGVTCVLCPNGMTMDHWHEGLRKHLQR